MQYKISKRVISVKNTKRIAATVAYINNCKYSYSSGMVAFYAAEETDVNKALALYDKLIQNTRYKMYNKDSVELVGCGKNADLYVLGLCYALLHSPAQGEDIMLAAEKRASNMYSLGFASIQKIIL
jgi:hypothetical protein